MQHLLWRHTRLVRQRDDGRAIEKPITTPHCDRGRFHDARIVRDVRRRAYVLHNVSQTIVTVAPESMSYMQGQVVAHRQQENTLV